MKPKEAVVPELSDVSEMMSDDGEGAPSDEFSGLRYNPGRQERATKGRLAREHAPRRSHGGWAAAPDRRDPIELLVESGENRIARLLPIRYGRMAVSPFTFLRGSALVMASDLLSTPTTGVHVQACGDAHLSNFGMYASPERTLLFDLNDFDETLPAPWEYDVKRLTASFAVSGRVAGHPDRFCREAAETAAGAYRRKMLLQSGMGNLDVWYTAFRIEEQAARIEDVAARQRLEKFISKVRQSGQAKAVNQLTELTPRGRQFKNQPPLIVRHETEELLDQIRKLVHRYTRSLRDDVRVLFNQYQFVDAAIKVVGVGSVGTICHVVLLQGCDADDWLVLQVKQANHSVLERTGLTSQFRNQGHRIVAGQRLMQSSSDVFLGWYQTPWNRDFYWRQLKDMKGSFDPLHLSTEEFLNYARICGSTLAAAHARSGQSVEIAAYLGQGNRADEAFGAFAMVYADQTERDYELLRKAIKSGRVPAEMNI